MRTFWMWARVILVVLAPLAGVVGCQRTPRVPVEIQGLPLRPDLGTDVEVVNWNGTVRVEAGPRHSSPDVRARVRRLTRQGPEGSELRAAVNVEAVSLIENGRRLVRVRGVPTGTASEEEVAIDVIVRVARADDVRIINSGGPVFVSGWSGGLTIDNGTGGRAGGNVEAATSEAIRQPVSIATSRGKVIFRSGTGTTGMFVLSSSDDSQAQFEVKTGVVTEARPDPSGTRYRAVLDGGTNPISLRSDKGTVRAEVMPRAGEYGPSLWDGYPNPESGPRWWRALAGGMPEQEAKRQEMRALPPR